MKAKSIRKKILVLVLSLLLISISIVSLVFSIFSLGSTEITIEKMLSQTVNTAAIAVKNELESTTNIIEVIANSNILYDGKNAEQVKINYLSNYYL